MGERELAPALQLVQELAASGGDPPPRYLVKEGNLPTGSAPPASPVPVVDLSRLFGPAGDGGEAAKLKEALQSWGLVQIIGHDMSPSFLDEVSNIAKKFFHLPTEEKEKYSNMLEGEFSYEGYGNDRVVSKDQILDWTDRLYLLVQPEDQRKLVYWPEKPSAFRNIVHEFTIKTRKVADRFLLAMAKLLELDDSCFLSQFGDSATVFARFNFYPSCPRPDLVFGLKPHNDASAFTIILPDKDVDGLEVVKDGEWVKVTTIPHALLINLGDQMEIMSNGIFKSPMHRAVTNSLKERLSVALFYAVEPEKEIGPADGLVDETRRCLYKKVKVKDYLEVFFGNFTQGRPTIDWAKI